MELIIAIFLTLTAPVFYIIGLITVIKWLIRQSKPQTSAGQPSPAPATPAPAVHAAAPAPPVPPTRPAPAGLKEISHSLENINLLLYLGAFLVVVSAGIFVGYNFSVLSGAFKTVFLALFAAAFYGTGLVLFLRSRKLRPAGVTFTGIGLVLLPLVGLAAYNFTSLHEHGPATWFATSLLTLAAYIATLVLTRQTYVAYLMAFTTLSVFESSVSLFDLPLYWFGWVMATVSILLLTVSRTKLFWEDARSALMVSANIFVPASLLLATAAVDSDGLSQLGVTIGLSGIFYAAMAARFTGRPAADWYWGLALASLPLALGVGLWSSLSRGGIALVMLVVAAAYFGAEYALGNHLSRRWRKILAVVTGLLPLAGIGVLHDHYAAVTAMLVGAALINAKLAARLRLSGLGLIAILCALAVPYVFLRLYISPALPWSNVAGLLLAKVPLLVWWSQRMRGWPESGTAVGASGYLMALFLALVAAGASSPDAFFVIGLSVAGILYGLSVLEHRPVYVYGAAACLYLALLQPLAIYGWNVATGSLIFLLAGAALYLWGNLEPNPERAQALRNAGLVGPFLGAVLGLGQDSRIEPALALATGGALLLADARRRPFLLEFGGGILVLSFNWLLHVADVTQLQAYTLPWAAYSAYLAYRRRQHGRQAYDPFAAVALGVLTLPLAAQALAPDGQMYGLLLVLEALALVALGMVLKYRLVTIWGAATLVLEVLYQMRDFFFALPKYLISAALGLALLAAAIILLQRRKGDD